MIPQNPSSILVTVFMIPPSTVHRSRLHAFDFLIHGHLLCRLTTHKSPIRQKICYTLPHVLYFLLARVTWYISVNITPLLAKPRGHTTQRPTYIYWIKIHHLMSYTKIEL